MRPLVDGALKEGALVPINGIRWLPPYCAKDALRDKKIIPTTMIACFISVWFPNVVVTENIIAFNSSEYFKFG